MFFNLWLYSGEDFLFSQLKSHIYSKILKLTWGVGQKTVWSSVLRSQQPWVLSSRVTADSSTGCLQVVVKEQKSNQRSSPKPQRPQTSPTSLLQTCADILYFCCCHLSTAGCFCGSWNPWVRVKYCLDVLLFVSSDGTFSNNDCFPLRHREPFRFSSTYTLHVIRIIYCTPGHGVKFVKDDAWSV